MKSNFLESEFKLDIRKNILSQFAQQLDLPIIDQQINLANNIGKGTIQLHSFPQQLELYHLKVEANAAIKMNSKNPADSDWLLININLANTAISKTVNQQALDIQKYLPSGMLFYTPCTEVHSASPPHNSFEIALIRFPKSFLSNYLTADFSILQNTQNALIYEDLDVASEKLLLNALQSTTNKLKRHSSILGFLGIFADKLTKRTTKQKYHNLHPNDVKNLFVAATLLRNPLAKQIPTIEQLAKMSSMGTTKFKNCFKQVFGSPPIKYHQKIRMAYAQKELLEKQKSISEISYELGYSHPSKFTVAFKKTFNCLPSEI